MSTLNWHEDAPDKYEKPSFDWLEKTNQEKHLATIKKNMSNPSFEEEVEALREKLQTERGHEISDEELQEALEDFTPREEEIF